MGDLSPHLSWSELACHDPHKTPYPAEWRITPGRRLATMFERFRAFCGGFPLTVASGYRTPAWNRLQGGARHSQHVQGRAIDLYPPRGMSIERFHQLARECSQIESSLIRGLGLYGWGVHLDLRHSERLVVWNKVSAGTRLHDRA